MLETAAALCAGLGVTVAALALALPAPSTATFRPFARMGPFVREARAREAALAAGAGWSWLTPRRLLGLQVLAAAIGALTAALATNIAVLGAPGAVGGVAMVRALVLGRSRALRRRRQDAVLASVRMLRQLLETGATGVPQAIAILGERGPAPLRHEFRSIATASGRRYAWSAARERIAEPLFDLLAAAVLIQHRGGGELVPLFVELEGSVSAAQEVEREGEALQVQARSAAAIIVTLPIGFLVVMTLVHSPYLDAFRQPAGEAFLLSMLGVMAVSYAWMRRLLRLPGMARMRLADA